MPATNPSWPSPQLTVKSQLEDLTLVWPWVEALAAHYSVPASTQFAIQLCLEEALSNIVRHGYRGQANQPITVACAVERASPGARELVFTIEDRASHFDPFALSQAAPAPAPATLADFEPGGQGIRLIRKFAGRYAYRQLPNGNRLTLAFALPAPL